MDQEAEYSFRPYIQEDIPFIQSSWGISYYAGGRGHQQLDPDEFHKYHRPIRERALSNPNCAAIICVAKSDPSLIIAWILVEKPLDAPYLKLHYIYTKGAFMGQGIASELLNKALPIRPVLYTHRTQKAQRIIKENWKSGKQKYQRFIHAPHLV